MKKILFAAALVAAMVTSLGTAQAAIVVTTDSGNIGQFSAVNTAVSAGGTATVVFAVPSVTAAMNTVNGLFVAPEPVSINTPVTLFVTPTGGDNYNLALSPLVYQQRIGAVPAASAVLDFTLDKGVAPASLPNFFNMSGLVQNLAQNTNPTYDFSAFASAIGKGSINITLTATTFGGGATNFRNFFTTVGATAVGNGSFSNAAVPEPSSLGLGAVMVVGAGLYRLWRRRSSK